MEDITPVKMQAYAFVNNIHLPFLIEFETPRHALVVCA